MSGGSSTPRRAERGERRPRRPALVVGVIALVAALGFLGWTVWDLVVRPPVDAATAAADVAALRTEWASGEASADSAQPRAGEAVGILSLPSLGAEEWPVRVGTDAASLDRGVGWYEGTTEPGQVGNFAVAGHGGIGGPFGRLTGLSAGDRVVVETRDAIHTYELADDRAAMTVAATDTWVLQPVPGRPELRPTEALITLTSTRDPVRSDERVVSFGTLVGTTRKG